MLQLHRTEVIMLEVYPKAARKEMVGNQRIISQPPVFSNLPAREHLIVERGAWIDAHNTQVVDGTGDLLQVQLSTREPFMRVMGKAQHHEAAHLDSHVVCQPDGFRERLAHILEFAH